MMKPAKPINETERLEALKSYDILYSGQTEEFDQITDLAKTITGLPVSLISLVGDNDVWFKSANGLDIISSNKDLSFCSYAVSEDTIEFIIEDIKNDKRFLDHPYVVATKNPIHFYAGVCLVDARGFKLGTLCVIDHKPNKIGEPQVQSLHILAKQVVKLIELHKANNDLFVKQTNLKSKNNELENFAGVVSHDMKMPLANIILTTDILNAKYGELLDSEALDYLKYLKDSSFTLSNYITGLLEHYESDKLAQRKAETFDIHHLLEDIVDSLQLKIVCDINFPEENIDINCNRAALEQILLRLIQNSIESNDEEHKVIDILCSEQSEAYVFTISDNGNGTSKEKLATIFNGQNVPNKILTKGQLLKGISLSTVKKIITNLRGMIKVKSNYGSGTTVEFSIMKVK